MIDLIIILLVIEVGLSAWSAISAAKSASSNEKNASQLHTLSQQIHWLNEYFSKR